MKKFFLFLTICSIQIVFSQGKPYNDDVKTIKGGPINVPEITNTEKNQLGIQIEKESFNNNGSEFQGTNDGIIDGVFIKENIPSKRVMAEEPIREADVTFQRRLWRDIDLREMILLNNGSIRISSKQNDVPKSMFILDLF